MTRKRHVHPLPPNSMACELSITNGGGIFLPSLISETTENTMQKLKNY